MHAVVANALALLTEAPPSHCQLPQFRSRRAAVARQLKVEADRFPEAHQREQQTGPEPEAVHCSLSEVSTPECGQILFDDLIDANRESDRSAAASVDRSHPEVADAREPRKAPGHRSASSRRRTSPR